MTLFPVFTSKADIAIKLVLTVLFCCELYMNIWLIMFYKKKRDLFNQIGRHIQYMPAIWMLQWLWNIADFCYASALYTFYKEASITLTADYNVVDCVTLLVLLNIVFVKNHPQVLLRLRYTLLALVLQLLVVITSAGILFVFASNGLTDEIAYMSPYFVWNLYLFYINFHWARVEKERF